MLSIETRESGRAVPRLDFVPVAVSVVILMLLAVATNAPWAAAADLSGTVLPPVRTIQVDGDGEARAKPDLAALSVAIETHAATAEKCAGLNASLADKVSDALKSELGGNGTIQTGGYSLFPEYSERPTNEHPRIIGYRAENSVRVETTDIKLVGPLIDTAIGAGANQINSLDFMLKDNTRARSEAIAKASQDAQAQAAALAASLGVKLKQIYSATTVSESRPMPMAFRAMASANGANAPTPVEAGEVTVPAHVSLVYEIE
jgi:uncharacterized protein